MKKISCLTTKPTIHLSNKVIHFCWDPLWSNGYHQRLRIKRTAVRISAMPLSFLLSLFYGQQIADSEAPSEDVQRSVDVQVAARKDIQTNIYHLISV